MILATAWARSAKVEHLIEQDHLGSEITRTSLGHRSAIGQPGIMDHRQPSVAASANVQLDALGARVLNTGKRISAIDQIARFGAAMAVDQHRSGRASPLRPTTTGTVGLPFTTQVPSWARKRAVSNTRIARQVGTRADARH